MKKKNIVLSFLAAASLSDSYTKDTKTKPILESNLPLHMPILPGTYQVRIPAGYKITEWGIAGSPSIKKTTQKDSSTILTITVRVPGTKKNPNPHPDFTFSMTLDNDFHYQGHYTITTSQNSVDIGSPIAKKQSN